MYARGLQADGCGEHTQNSNSCIAICALSMEVMREMRHFGPAVQVCASLV